MPSSTVSQRWKRRRRPCWPAWRWRRLEAVVHVGLVLAVEARPAKVVAHTRCPARRPPGRRPCPRRAALPVVLRRELHVRPAVCRRALEAVGEHVVRGAHEEAIAGAAGSRHRQPLREAVAVGGQQPVAHLPRRLHARQAAHPLPGTRPGMSGSTARCRRSRARAPRRPRRCAAERGGAHRQRIRATESVVSASGTCVSDRSTGEAAWPPRPRRSA
jgi:hypothetical protein